MCRCLMGIDVVSQHGPNPQSRTADRSVSLPDARETAAEMMGGVTSIRLQRLRARHADLEKRYGDRLRDTSAPYDQALEQVVDELAEIEAEIRELDPPDDPPPPPLVQAWDLDDPAQRKAAIEKWGGRHLDPVPDLPPGTSAMAAVGGFDPAAFELQAGAAANDIPWDAFGENERWEALGRTQEAQDLFDEGKISAEELERRRELSDEEIDRMYDDWRREDAQERKAQWEDPRPHSDDEFSHESRAVNLPSGLPGFQPAAALPQPGGYQGAPPSVESMLTAMSGEPPRTGRAHPERPPAPYEPVPEIPDEDRERGKEEIEKIRKEHNLYEGMDPELLRDILLAAGIGAGAAAFGGGGMMGGFGSGVGAFR